MKPVISSGLILLLVASLDTPVLAGEQLPDEQLDEQLIEEIHVTAARREQTLQSLPNSAKVFSGQDLEELSILEPRDLAEQTPGLLTKFGPNGLATVGFYMRGVGINDFTGTVDPSVGIYVDDVFKPTPDMLNFAVFDIERVEVLRGPQGTLYGRNSTAGAINFISAKPTETLEGFVRGEVGSFGTNSLIGAVSGPLNAAGSLLGRISVKGQVSDDDRGYSRNAFTGSELGNDDQTAVRGQLEWRPSETFTARMVYGYGDQESDQALLQHVSTRDPDNPGAICAAVIAGQRDEFSCVDSLGFSDRDGDFFAGNSNLSPELEIQTQDITLNLEWELDRATITSITGTDDFEKEQSQDIDASPNVAADNFTFSQVDNFSQEFRVTSDDSFGFNWIIGASYAKTDVDWFQTIDLSDLAGIPTSNGAEQETESWAVFGQVEVPLSERFELVGGLRFTNEQRDWEGATFIGTFASLSEGFAASAPTLSQLPIPAGNPLAGGPTDFDNTLDEDNLDFQVVLKYTPDESATYYAKVSEAFRSGGFSSAVLFSQEALEPFDPEDLLAYEVGAKLALLERKLRLDASVFFYDFEGFQATFVRATEASARLQNAGDVEIYGLEVSLDWTPRANLNFNLGVSLLDTEIASTEVVLPPLDGGPETTIRGNDIPNAPSLSLNGRATYDIPITGEYLLRAQADFNCVEEHFLEPNNRRVLEEDGYFLVNARLAFTPTHQRWEVAAWVKNIGDTEYLSSAQDLALALGFSEIVLGLPRTWGLQFAYNF